MSRTATFVSAATLLGLAVLLTLLGVGEADGATFPEWQALVLGIVQGLTELLPVSSSGHLILVPWLGDWTYLEQHDAFNQTFDVALHLGTLVAVVAYFWRDIVELAGALVGSIARRRIRSPAERTAWVVAVATVPAALVGAAGESVIAEHLGEPWQIAIFLAVFAGVLWLADRRPERKTMDEVGLWGAFGIGCAQALALMPGVSRSGITIYRRPLPRADPRRRRAALVSAPRPDRARRRAAEGRDRRAARRPAGGVGGTVPRRHARRRGQRLARDSVAARLRAPPRLHRVRRLPPGRRGDHRAVDRERRPTTRRSS